MVHNLVPRDSLLQGTGKKRDPGNEVEWPQAQENTNLRSGVIFLAAV